MLACLTVNKKRRSLEDSHKAKVLEPHIWKYEGEEEADDAANDGQGNLGLCPGKVDRLQLISAL